MQFAAQASQFPRQSWDTKTRNSRHCDDEERYDNERENKANANWAECGDPVFGIAHANARKSDSPPPALAR